MATLPKPLSTIDSSSAKPATRTPRTVTRNAATKHSAPREPIAAAKAKAHFLQLLDEVEHHGEAITITKRGRVVAQLIPACAPEAVTAFDQVFGSMKGWGKITGDIVSPDWESWGQKWR